MARSLSFDFKLSARTAPELYEAFNRLVLKLEAEGVKFRGRKVSVEATLNAVLIDFFGKSDEERERLVRQNVPRFEQILASDQPTDVSSLAASGPGRPHAIRNETEGVVARRRAASKVKSKGNHKGSEGQGSPVPTR